MLMFRPIVVLTLFACALLGCRNQSTALCECPAGAEEPETAADEERYTLPGLDHGLVQSPVNILSDDAVDGRHRIALHFDRAAPHFLINKGATIEIDFPKGSSINYDRTKFDLKQLHFHTPSEHQIDGITFPMEMHIVNRATEERSDGLPHYLVISVLFKMGKSNHFIAGFLDAVPLVPGEKRRLAPDTVYLDELFPGERMPRYYHYRGSLTTPPHSETVDWLVLKHVIEASPEQIQRINQIEGDNARHVQALYGRPIDD